MKFTREELIEIVGDSALMARLNNIYDMVLLIQETERRAADNEKQQAEKKPIRYEHIPEEHFAILEQALEAMLM